MGRENPSQAVPHEDITSARRGLSSKMLYTIARKSHYLLSHPCSLPGLVLVPGRDRARLGRALPWAPAPVPHLALNKATDANKCGLYKFPILPEHLQPIA